MGSSSKLRFAMSRHGTKSIQVLAGKVPADENLNPGRATHLSLPLQLTRFRAACAGGRPTG